MDIVILPLSYFAQTFVEVQDGDGCMADDRLHKKEKETEEFDEIFLFTPYWIKLKQTIRIFQQYIFSSCSPLFTMILASAAFAFVSFFLLTSIECDIVTLSVSDNRNYLFSTL